MSLTTETRPSASNAAVARAQELKNDIASRRAKSYAGFSEAQFAEVNFAPRKEQGLGGHVPVFDETPSAHGELNLPASALTSLQAATANMHHLFTNPAIHLDALDNGAPKHGPATVTENADLAKIS